MAVPGAARALRALLLPLSPRSVPLTPRGLAASYG